MKIANIKEWKDFLNFIFWLFKNKWCFYFVETQTMFLNGLGTGFRENGKARTLCIENFCWILFHNYVQYEYRLMCHLLEKAAPC